MLNVDISNIWCSVTLPQLLEQEQTLFHAHSALTDGKGANFLSWLDDGNEAELSRVNSCAVTLRERAQVLVVVGNDSAVHGAHAALALLAGESYNLRNTTQILFTGSHLSTQSWQSLSEQLEERDFCVLVVGRDGEAIETAVTLRSLRWLLERRYGTEKAREHLFVVTDPHHGFLRQLSIDEGCTAFNLPSTLAGHASVLAPAALLPLAVAGIDIARLLAGAREARIALAVRAFENPAWLYAGARSVLSGKGKRVEYLTAAEPDAARLCRWWQQLFGARACCEGGLLPACAELPADLAQMHAALYAAHAPVVQTMLHFAPSAQRVPIEMDWKNTDNLNYLEGFSLDYVQEQQLLGAIQAGNDADTPIISIDCDEISPETAGQLFYFFELTSCLCAGMAAHDCYEKPPAPGYVKATAGLLGK